MLKLSEKCFNEAMGKEDGDPWLQYYMLGKIGESLNSPPDQLLENYIKAARALDEDGATYPKKIPYHNPPEYSQEALEVTTDTGSKFSTQIKLSDCQKVKSNL